MSSTPSAPSTPDTPSTPGTPSHAGRKRGRVRIAWMVAGGYAALVGLARLTFRAVLYPAPQRGLGVVPAGAQLRQHRAADGVPVQALHFAAAGALTIVYFHGNGETIGDVVGLAEELVRRGLGVVLVEYRGYGDSPGRGPSEAGLYLDAEAVLVDLHAGGVGPADLCVWGSSLGSGVAVEMALRGHARRLVLSSPFTSIPAVAWRMFPLLPMRLVVPDVFDNLAKAPHLTVPTLVLHGERDRLVPHDMGVTLAGAIPGATMLSVPDAGHNDLFLHGGNDLFDSVERHAKRLEGGR